jgi:hypothetical protein
MRTARHLGFRGVIAVLACVLALPAPVTQTAMAQSTPAQPAPAQPAPADADTYSAEQLDALLAPIALYPDALLTQILMAAGSPLDIVQASRWLDQPGRRDLKGDALTAALRPEPFDPAVKALVAFPTVLAQLNDHLDWTQQLGYAFAAQEAAVLASVQRLRRQARASGNLQSSPQQVVRVDNDAVVIEPVNPQIIYVPTYSPTVVYGAWPYPAYPPVVLPPPPGYVVGGALATGLAFGAGIAITAALWNLGRPNWGGGYVNVNVNRYNNLAVNTHRISTTTYRPRYPNAARPGVRPPPPNGPVGRPRPAGGAGAGQRGEPPAPLARRRHAVAEPAQPAERSAREPPRPQSPPIGQPARQPARPGQPTQRRGTQSPQPAHAEPPHAEPPHAEPPHAEPPRAEPAGAEPPRAQSAGAQSPDHAAGRAIGHA